MATGVASTRLRTPPITNLPPCHPLSAQHGEAFASRQFKAAWVAIDPARAMPTAFNTQNLRGQSLLFRCVVTGFVTTAPALSRYQQGRDIDPTQRELMGERPSNWSSKTPTTVCEHSGMMVKGEAVGIQATPAEKDA